MEGNLQVIEGNIIKMIYEKINKSSSPYSIYTLKVINTNFDLTEKTIPIIFHFAPPDLMNTNYKFFGKLIYHKRYGLQFECEAYVNALPVDLSHIIDFLASGIFKGIKRKRAQKIVETLGEDCLIKITLDPSVLNEVKGIPKESIETIQESLLRNFSLQNIIMKLNEWGISLRVAKKIHKAYGNGAIRRIEENPYILANNISGISFKKSDSIAENLDIKETNEIRIKGAIEYALNTIYNKVGSTWAIDKYIVEKTVEILYEVDGIIVDSKIIYDQLEELTKFDIEDNENFISDLGQVRKVGKRIYLEKYYMYEKSISDKICSLNAVTVEVRSEEQEKNFIEKCAETEYYFINNGDVSAFSEEQREFIQKVYGNQIVALTGGPGTGKSTILKAILMIYHKLNPELSFTELEDRIKLLAPTGRAAKRMAELTEFNASTIHQYLLLNRFDYSFGNMKKDIDTTVNLERFLEEDSKRPSRLFVIDESSMIDISLMKSFLETTKKGDRIILVGDSNQLPAVGAGNVFEDIINSEKIVVVDLKKVFRQEEDSHIIKLAQHIKAGNTSYKDLLRKNKNVKFLSIDKKEILSYLRVRIETLLNDGILFKDIKIICPVHKGEQGITSINEYIQRLMLVDAFNIGAKFESTNFSNDKYKFYVGDSVIQLKSNIEKGVTNGDLGVIKNYIPSIESEEGKDRLIIEFNNREFEYLKSDMEEIGLSYAFSIHKAQGSEFPHIILPIADSYKGMINKNLLYTAVTRAKESISIIGNVEVFKQGIKKNPIERFSFLEELLKNRINVELKNS